MLSDGHTTFTAGLSSTVNGLSTFRHEDRLARWHRLPNVPARFPVTQSMELFFPLLAAALVYLASWAAGLYLLFQWVTLRHHGRRERNWTVAWGWVWPVFAASLMVTLTPLPPVWAAGRMGVFAPFFWLVSLHIYRKNRRAERRAPAEAARRADASREETVWPPPPRL